MWVPLVEVRLVNVEEIGTGTVIKPSDSFKTSCTNQGSVDNSYSVMWGNRGDDFPALEPEGVIDHPTEEASMVKEVAQCMVWNVLLKLSRQGMVPELERKRERVRQEEGLLFFQGQNHEPTSELRTWKRQWIVFTIDLPYPPPPHILSFFYWKIYFILI